MIEKGILVSPEFLDKKEELIQSVSTNQLVLSINDIKKEESEKKIILNEAPDQLKKKNVKSTFDFNTHVVSTYQVENKKITIKDFVSLYNSRYIAIQSMLKQRQELQGATALRKVMMTNERDLVSCIGIVLEKGITKNGHIIFTLEDQTGYMKAIVTKNNDKAYALAKEVTEDEVIGMSGTKGKNVIFANLIVQPDVPLHKEFKKSPLKESVVFLSDLHIGSTVFLKENFERFLTWIKGETNDIKQNALTKNIKYLIISGDLVEGVGIFPGQKEELLIKNIHDQYQTFIDYIKQIPSHISVIICPGNHDALRIAEPQPPIPKQYLQELYDLENFFFCFES